MNLRIVRSDPFDILSSTKKVIENAKHVTINKNSLAKTAKQIEKHLKENADFKDHGHNLTGAFKTDVQLIFFESMMGFCFWTLPKKPKWSIKLSNGENVDGWYGVCASFKRALEDGIPDADVNYLIKAKKKDISSLFRSATGAEIPLLDKRVKILNKNAKILKKYFSGEAVNLIQKADHDAIKLFKLLIKYFPSYRDFAKYNGKKVVFLKIAHLLAIDLEYRLTPRSKQPFLKNVDKLSVFADYKLPQLLRMFGLLEYDRSLSKKVDSYAVIRAGSTEEVEMRAAAIWGVELLRQQLSKYSSMEIGQVIWLMSQNQKLQSKIKPYHRTYTTYY